MTVHLLYKLRLLWLLLLRGMATGTDAATELNNPCSMSYVIDEEPAKTTAMAVLFHARDKGNNEKVIIKVYRTRRHFRREETAYNDLDTLIVAKSRNEQAYSIDAKKVDGYWSHFVRLRAKCLHSGKAALVIELLDEILSETIKRGSLPKEATHTVSQEPPSKRQKISPIISSHVDKGPVPATTSSLTTAANEPCNNPTETHLFGYRTSVAFGETSSMAVDTNSVAAAPALCSSHPVSAVFFKSYAYQLLVAVGVLHGLGMFHFDLKPQNMGLTQDGTLKLFDFDTSASEVAPYYAGTLSYSAPEMNLQLTTLVEETHQLGKIDIWSIGCTIYEMFAAERFSSGINRFWMCVVSQEGAATAAVDCRPIAAYFYLKWSFGSITSAKFSEEYETAEDRAREQCPQIFSKECVNTLVIENPLVLFYAATDEETTFEVRNTAILQNMQNIKSGTRQNRARLDPNTSEPSELVELLFGLLKFDFNERITIQAALTEYTIFKGFPHQDHKKDKFGSDIPTDNVTIE